MLAAVGGLEHAALAGFILGAAALRVPVLLDGVIAGAAALLVDPYDTAAIGEALRRLAQDDEFCRRLSEAGLVQADHFSVTSYQASLQKLYDGILSP